jgi:hypothetical protein
MATLRKEKPDVIIESAQPLSGSSSEESTDSEEYHKPGRMNYMQVNQGYIPKGMMPVNSSRLKHEEEEEEEATMEEKSKPQLSLSHPLVLIAAALGLGFLISYYGSSLFKPALDTVVKAAEDLTEELNPE